MVVLLVGWLYGFRKKTMAAEVLTMGGRWVCGGCVAGGEVMLRCWTVRPPHPPTRAGGRRAGQLRPRLSWRTCRPSIPRLHRLHTGRPATRLSHIRPAALQKLHLHNFVLIYGHILRHVIKAGEGYARVSRVLFLISLSLSPRSD